MKNFLADDKDEEIFSQLLSDLTWGKLILFIANLNRFG